MTNIVQFDLTVPAPPGSTVRAALYLGYGTNVAFDWALPNWTADTYWGTATATLADGVYQAEVRCATAQTTVAFLAASNVGQVLLPRGEFGALCQGQWINYGTNGSPLMIGTNAGQIALNNGVTSAFLAASQATQLAAAASLNNGSNQVTTVNPAIIRDISINS
jgi:hypothetical protein